ncbi:hypothetical protein FQV39_13715 [Bosea sp. F3-2]|uniref:hypothetical protein n=1 Tax=Bosea sp. F3-2 TaxID=2599640 RepID=UPI0011F03C61|nr:hypothetical protein [Bosea sp. F3-2]QEL23518.1 hypothetical protein FQV39_13715 [Bosea sp. F3-2]
MQTNSDLSASLEFRGTDSRWAAIIYIALAGAAIHGAFAEGKAMTMGAVMLVGAALLLAALIKAIEEPDRSVRLAFDEEGLLLPHIFEQRIPWPEIPSYSVDNPEDSNLYVSIVGPDRFGIKSKGQYGGWDNFTKALTRFHVSLDYVDCTYDDIDAAFRRFAPAARRI